MPFVVEKDKSFDPMNVSFLGPVTIVAASDKLPDLVQEFRLPVDGSG
jgi:hypothetical protein